MGIGTIIAVFAFGLALVLCEVFVPGGLIGAVGMVLIGTSIYFSFDGGWPILGAVLSALTVIAVPVVIIKGLSRLSLKTAQTKAGGFSSSEENIEGLLGKHGVTLSALRPTGMARIDDRKLSVVTRGEMLYAHTKIEVVEVEGNRVVVRAVQSRKPLASDTSDK